MLSERQIKYLREIKVSLRNWDSSLKILPNLEVINDNNQVVDIIKDNDMDLIRVKKEI